MFEQQFADAVRSSLEAKGLSVNAAAQRAGIATSTLQSYLADTRPSQPSFAKAAAICAALGIELYIGSPRTMIEEAAPKPAPPLTYSGPSIWPAEELMFFAEFISELPEVCPLERPDFPCPILERVRAVRLQ